MKQMPGTASSPSLFGLNHSNRDFTSKSSWGKNQFNSSFPTALACYMHSKGLKALFIKAKTGLKTEISDISFDKLFGIDPLSSKAYFAFESPFIPYQKYVIGTLPRNDLAIINQENDICTTSIEIKLTALPDNSTCELDESNFGSEIVIRPDTIVYLACSIIQCIRNKGKLSKIINDSADIHPSDWTQPNKVLPYLKDIHKTIKNIANSLISTQIPVIMEPIWKTQGKSPRLSCNCLDIFVWSNLSMLNLFLPSKPETISTIGRQERTMIWLYKMLADYSMSGQFDWARIIDELSYNTKNDKAFSINGLHTHPLMFCKQLVSPRITKDEIKNIILGGGQNFLSPERRFDAIIYNSPDLFK